MGQESRMKIQLQRRGIRIEVILDANRATLELWPQLPMTVRLEDYQATEKIAYLPRRLLAASGLAGMTPVPGDVAYYAPWGNIALFYRGAQHASGLIRLGRLVGDATALESITEGDVRIERIGA